MTKTSADQDQVLLCAQKIGYHKQVGELSCEFTRNSKMREIGEPIHPSWVPEVLVEMDAWITDEQAIGALQQIISTIIADGLPSATSVMSRNSAMWWEDRELYGQNTNAMSLILRDLRPSLREQLTTWINNYSHGGSNE